jgi:hypothetical protein
MSYLCGVFHRLLSIDVCSQGRVVFRHRLFFLLVVLILPVCGEETFCSLCRAQNASNPFELLMRLPEEARTAATDGSAAVVNPFEVVPHKKPGAAQKLAGNETRPFTPFSIISRGGGMPASTIFWVLIFIITFSTLTSCLGINVI